MTSEQLMTTAKAVRKAKSTIDKLKIMREVPTRNQDALMKLVEELGKDKQGIEIYMNKAQVACGVKVYGEGTGKQGLYLSNKTLANWSAIQTTVSEYVTNASHTF